MSQVSKRLVERKIGERMFEVFFKSLADLHKSEEIEAYLLDLLSPVERTMIAKRLAIAILLTKGYSYAAIGDIVKVSVTTIASISVWLQHSGKGFEMVIKKILREESFKETLKDIEKSLAKFLVSPPASKRRVENRYEKEKQERISRII